MTSDEELDTCGWCGKELTTDMRRVVIENGRFACMGCVHDGKTEGLNGRVISGDYKKQREIRNAESNTIIQDA